MSDLFGNDQDRSDSEPTRPLPSYGQGSDPQAPATPPASTPPESTPPESTPLGSTPAPVAANAKPRRGLGTAALVGALVIGGAAGYGGAVLHDSTDSGSSGASATSTKVNVNTEELPAGTIEQVAEKVLPSVVRIDAVSRGGGGSGSGIIISADGAILTNEHVVSAGERITVSLHDGTSVRGKVLGTDPMTDLAVVKVDDVEGLVPATIGSSGDLRVGQGVVAIGSPYGLDATVTSGIVSALHRPVSVPNDANDDNTRGNTTYPAVQTDAAINPGNSGGPLVDLAGRVVGINSSIRTTGFGESGSIGLGFAIGIDEAMPIVDQILKGEEPTHARLAITVSNVEEGAAAQGAQVKEVNPGGPADEAGLKVDDIITKVGSTAITGSESLVATIRGKRPGDEVELTIRRGEETLQVKIELGSDADN